MTPRSKRLATRFLLGISVALVVAVTFDGLAIVGHRQIPLVVLIAITALLSASAVYAMVPFVHALDDRQRNMRFTTWYWGGLLGLMFGLLTATAISLHGLLDGPLAHNRIWVRDHALAGPMGGAMLVVICQMVGYYSARLVWLRKNRIPAA